MGISNLVVKTAGTFPQTLTGLISRRTRRVKGTVKAKRPSGQVSVGELLAPNRSIPEQSILLGRCADGLPFLMSLAEPEIGAILISGDRGCGKTHHLQVMVDSVIRTHRPHEIQVTIISHNPEEWRQSQLDPHVDKYIQGVFAWYDPRVEGHIQRLVEVVEASRNGEREGPANLVILDDLNFIETLSCEAQVNLRWLLEYGSQSKVWLVGALNSFHAKGLDFWLEVFRTRIFGWARGWSNVDLPDQKPGLQPETLDPGTFRAWADNRWITYQIPLLGDGISRSK